MGYYATGYGEIKLLKEDINQCAAEIKAELKYRCEVDIYDILNYIGFGYVDEDDDNNIIGISFDAKYYDNEVTTALNILAKYTDGYVEFHGEDDAHWKFVMKDGVAEEMYGSVYYLDDPEDRKFMREILRRYDDE